MLDYLIKGGTVIDGTGSAGVTADVGIGDGRIVAIGLIDDEAAETIDATGKIVCPGFVDPHTHYDAQLFWDPYATPSNLHGVTSVIMGNCGFSIAPVATADDGDYLKHMLTKVEGMALESLEEGVPWDWNSFAEYLAKLEGNIGVNAACMVGHNALRRSVMHDDAVGNEATPEQIEAMVALLHESIEAGGLGFSTTLAYTHSDIDGKPVPSRWAANDEVIALAAAVGEHEGTALEWNTDGCMNGYSDEEIELMTEMSVAADRPLNWNVFTIDSARPDEYSRQLDASVKAAEGGGRVVALTMPIIVGMNMSFRFYCALNLLPGWNDILSLPLEERMEKLADPDVRRQLEVSAASPEAGVVARLTGWTDYVIGDTFSEANDGLKGQRVGDIARERGQRDFYTLLDIVLADELKTVLWPSATDDDAESWRLRQKAWANEHVMIGGSDAGAHLDRMAGQPYTTEWIGDCLRGRKLTTVEDAIHNLTDVPARLFGLIDRGRLAEGWHADVVVFDPDTIGTTDVELVFDLPGNAKRLWTQGVGIERVFVNGTPIVVDGEATGARPGTLLKSGVDTETVSVSS